MHYRRINQNLCQTFCTLLYPAPIKEAVQKMSLALTPNLSGADLGGHGKPCLGNCLFAIVNSSPQEVVMGWLGRPLRGGC